jgi:hypothetical protein
MTDIQTYIPENYESLQARGEDHEDRWWKVAYAPDKDSRELCQCDVRHAYVPSFNNVSLKVRERHLVKASREQEIGNCVCAETLKAEVEIARFACAWPS